MEKIICHIDVNSAYLSWTALQHLQMKDDAVDLRQVPSVISRDKESRHSVVLAKSVPAKAYGIQTGEPLLQAQRKCADLLVASPEFALYLDYSSKFIAILAEMAPVVEQFSIDEAWIDISGTKAIYGSPLEAARLIKKRIYDQLGFTVNIGISTNKLLSKMASDFSKPDQIHTLFPHEIEQKMWPLPVRQLFSVGAATAEKLNSIGIMTIGDLAKAAPGHLALRLHKQAYVLCDYANGRGEEELARESSLNKCYGNSTTTAVDVADRQTAHKILLSLSETVGMRMRRDGQKGRCLAVQIRSNQFIDTSKQAQLTKATNNTSAIYHQACELFDQLWDKHTPLRLLGISISKLGEEAASQYALFEDDNNNQDKLAQIDSAVDKIREKFGDNAIKRARFADSGEDHMAGALSKEMRKNGGDKGPKY